MILVMATERGCPAPGRLRRAGEHEPRRAAPHRRRRHDHAPHRQDRGGPGARTELALAAAEELRVPLDRVRVMTADTDLTPNDGTTAGSGTTPRTVPAVRKAAAAARELLAKASTEAGRPHLFGSCQVSGAGCEVQEHHARRGRAHALERLADIGYASSPHQWTRHRHRSASLPVGYCPS